MKKIFIFLILVIFNLNINAQKRTISVTKSMSDKIAKECLCNKSYAITVFYKSNKEFISTLDILKGRGRDILNNLYKYPKYSENFIRDVYKAWGYNGLKNIGFTDEEIIISKQIINKTFE